MITLSSQIAEYSPDGLITDIVPEIVIRSGELTGAAETTYSRGTLLSKSGTAVTVYDGTSDPNCILCDDITFNKDGTEVVSVYVAGCFNQTKIEEVTDVELSDDAIETLREKGIFLKSAQTM